MDRHLDTVYFRVFRDGKWRNICFSDLTPAERADVLADKDLKWMKSLCCILADTIKEIGSEFDLKGN